MLHDSPWMTERLTDIFYILLKHIYTDLHTSRNLLLVFLHNLQ